MQVLITLNSRVFQENLIVAHNVKKFPVFVIITKFIVQLVLVYRARKNPA